MFQFSKKLVLFLSLLLPYSIAQSSSLNIMGDGIRDVLGNDTIRYNSNNTYIPEAAAITDSSSNPTSTVIEVGITIALTLVADRILAPLLDRCACYHVYKQKLSRAWYSCKNYLSPCCRGICNPSSSETMDLNQVIARPRKSWCCFSQTRPEDFEESLHLLDRHLGNTGWVKSPVIENDQFFRLVGFRYQQGNNWIAIIREYIDTNVEPYELHPSLQHKDTYVLQQKVEKIRSQIKGVKGDEQKYFNLDKNGLEVINESQNQSSSNLLKAGADAQELRHKAEAKAKELSDDFVNGLLPLPLSGTNTEPAPVTVLRDRLQEILRRWKKEGVIIEIDNDKQNAYMQAKPSSKYSNRISVYLSNGNGGANDSDRMERASAATSSSSSGIRR